MVLVLSPVTSINQRRDRHHDSVGQDQLPTQRRCQPNPETIGRTLGCSGLATTNKTPLQAVMFKWMDTKKVSIHASKKSSRQTASLA
jgi:hypothetical protein